MKRIILAVVALGIGGVVQSQTFFNQQVLKAEASERALEDYFGFVVDISGDYAIVGAGYEDEDENDENTLAESGSAYIFERTSTGWSRAQKLVASDRSTDDYFGYAVAISGDYAIVGASYHELDESGANSKTGSGAAYIYERGDDGIWVESQKLVASDRSVEAEFGISVGISGDYAIIGAYGDDNYKGAVYLFERDVDGSWNEVKKLNATDAAEGDELGNWVSISGNYAIAGAAAANNYTGAAYIFERDVDGVWSQDVKLVASDAATNDTFGSAVAISEDYAIVGALGEDEDEDQSNTVNDAGSVYIFEQVEPNFWTQTQKIVASVREPNDQFGFSVALSGEYLVVGAHQEDEWITDEEASTSTVSNAGSAYIFKRSSAGAWSQTEKLATYDRDEGDNFGTSVAMDQGFLIVGAQGESSDSDGDAGAAYIFEGLITWKGNEGTDWGTAANWEDKIVPTSMYNVHIPTVATQPVISDERMVNSIELGPEVSLTIASGGSLAVLGSVSGNGKAIVQRSVLGGDGSANSGGYQIIGSPLSNATVATLNDPNRVYAYNGSAYQNLTNSTTTALVPGQGYFVAYDESSPTMELRGVLNYGDLSTSLTYTDDGDSENDYNLVSNPYAAAISHSEWVEINGASGSGVVDGAVYFWDDGGSNLGDGTRDGVYQSFDADGDASTVTTTTSFDGYIRSGQGFFVRATSAEDLEFNASMMVDDTESNNDVGFFRKSGKQLVRIALSKGAKRDETLVKFNEASTLHRELGYDVNKFMNPSISIYTMMHGQELAIQSLPSYEGGSVEIDLGFAIVEPGTYNLSITTLEGISESTEIVLIDKLTGQSHTISQDNSIDLELNELASTNRFTLILGPQEVLVDKKPSSGLALYGTTSNLTISASEVSGTNRVQIYKLDGMVVFDELVTFSNGVSTIQTNLSNKQLYILRVNGMSLKFILK